MVPEIKARSWTMFGRGQREDLDDEEGIRLAARIRSEIEKDVQVLEDSDRDSLRVLGKL